MIKKYRESFNANFSLNEFKSFEEKVLNQFKKDMGFRLSETPIFLDKQIGKDFKDACDYIIQRIKQKDIWDNDKVVPIDSFVPGEQKKPSVICIDFGICNDKDGVIQPQLIELQGFPSLFCYQAQLGYRTKEYFNFGDDLSFIPEEEILPEEEYYKKLKDFILGGYAEENVILLEIHPERQKTRIDFKFSEEKLGINSVHLGDVIKEGKKLYYIHKGKKIRINRIYNRIIFDELNKYDSSKFNFYLTDEVDVEWVTHPNWYFKISKAILPKLEHKCIPNSYFLNECPEDLDLSKYVLKPLFSFSGTGVNINPTEEDIQIIEDKESYILQEKVNYAPIFKDVNGDLARAEVRLLFIWEDDKDEPEVIINLTRMSKSEKVNVSHLGKEDIWTGSSIALFKV